MRAVGQAYQKEIKHFGPWRVEISESGSNCDLILCGSEKLEFSS